MEQKTVVITGSTRGIGHGLAMELLKRGHRVIINGRSEEAVARCVKELAAQNLDVEGVAGDVVHPDTYQSIIDKAVSQYGKIDIWINNAGIPQSHRYFHDLDDEEIERVVSVNIVGMMTGTRAAISFFRQQGFGKVLNMEGFGSNGRIMEKLTLYGTTKRAVNYFTKSVSRELKGGNIQAGILSPGMVRTDFIKVSMDDESPVEQARIRKVFDILAEDVEVVTAFLTEKLLKSTRHYDRIEYLTRRRMIPKIMKLMFMRNGRNQN